MRAYNGIPKFSIHRLTPQPQGQAKRALPCARRRTRCGCWLLIAAVAVFGCNGPSDDAHPAADAKPQDYPQLASPLFALATSSQAQEKAKQLGLDFQGGLVLVVVEVKSSEGMDDVRWGIEVLQGHVELAQETALQARVPPRALLPLSNHPRVAYVRAPVKAKLN